MNQKKQLLALSIFAILATSVVLALGTSPLSQSTSEEIPMAAGGPGATVPACSIPTQAHDISVTFPRNASTYLTAHNENRATMEATNLTGGEIPPGQYEVILESYDNHDGTIPVTGSVHDQQHEQWQAQLFSDDNTLIAESNAIGDIPDEVQSIFETVNTNLEITESIESVIAKHAFYPSENPQSHYPICAVFRPVDDPPINNNCQKPKDFKVTSLCDEVTSEGSATINWAKVDEAINGYTYQLSRAKNFKANNKIAEDSLKQPLGSVRPSTTITYSDPPTLYFRARSQCANSEVSKWSNWQTIDFEPHYCGGPTPTPSPIPTYNVTVNLKATENNECVESKPLLRVPFLAECALIRLNLEQATLISFRPRQLSRLKICKVSI